MANKADAFRTLYDANHRQVLRFLARMVGPQEAEDLAQAVFAKAAQALPGFRGEAQISTWLYRIAANAATDWLCSRAAQEAKLNVQPPEDAGGKPAARSACDAQEPSPEQQLIRQEMNACIRRVIGELPEDHRAVLVLGEVGGFSDDEVAQTLGISRGNAKVRLHRARARLKQALEGRCDFYRSENNELACEPKPAAGCAPAQRPGCSGTGR